jgi:hypothetical protein
VETSYELKVTISWNQKTNTARTIATNKPNIMIRVNEKETCLLMDTKIAGNRT